MIILINSIEILRIPAEEWLLSSEVYFPSTRNSSLALVVEKDQEGTLLSITSPRLIHLNCLNNKIIINSEKLFHSLQNDLIFKSLLYVLTENSITNLSPDEISLLSYFYLNVQPFSLTLVSRWFSDTGTAQSRADSLAKLVFMARTDKEDQEPGFIEKIECLNNRMEPESVQNNFKRIPVNLSDAFELVVKYPDYRINYDFLGYTPQLTEESGSEIYLGEMAETGFLVEDHALIIAGLSVKVTELAKLTEYKWPLFTASLLNDIPLHLRDYYSLGRLLLEKSALFIKLGIDSDLKMNILCNSRQAGNTSHQFEDFETLLFSNHLSEIPLMLRIIK